MSKNIKDYNSIKVVCNNSFNSKKIEFNEEILKNINKLLRSLLKKNYELTEIRLSNFNLKASND